MEDKKYTINFISYRSAFETFMSHAKRGVLRLETRPLNDFNPTRKVEIPHAGQVLILADRLSNSQGVLAQGAKLGHWFSLQEAFVKNPELLNRFLERFSQAALLGLYTLESEADEAIFAHHAMTWVHNHVEALNLNLAVSLYQSWSKAAVPSLALLAQRRWDLLQNQGAAMETAAYRLGKVAQVFRDPVTLASFAFSGGAYAGFRAFVLPRILSLGLTTRVAGLLATVSATIPEAMAFGGFMNVGQQFFYGQRADWSWAQFRNLVTAFLTFKATGAMAASLAQWSAKTLSVSQLGVLGRSFMDLTQAVAPSLGTYGGIVAAHGGQEALGWREGGHGGNLWFDSAVFFLELRAGGAASQLMFPEAYAVGEFWNRRMQGQVLVQARERRHELEVLFARTDLAMEAPIPEHGGKNVEAASKTALNFLRENPRITPQIPWSKTPTASKTALNDSLGHHVEILNDRVAEHPIIFGLVLFAAAWWGGASAELPFVLLMAKQPAVSLAERRARILEIRQGLSPDPQQAEQWWAEFEEMSTTKYREILRALSEHPEAGTIGKLADLANLNPHQLAKNIREIFRLLEEFRVAPENFISEQRRYRINSFTYKHAKILELKRGLDPDPDKAARLWAGFEARLPQGHLAVLRALIAHPETKNEAELEVFLPFGESTVSHYLLEVLQRLEIFSAIPEILLEPIREKDAFKSVLAKRDRILELKRGLSPHPQREALLWEVFQARLSEGQRSLLQACESHGTVKKLESFIELSGISEQSFRSGLPEIISALEKFIEDPQKYLKYVPPAQKMDPISKSRIRILELQIALSPDPEKAALLWERFLSQLSSSDLEETEWLMKSSETQRRIDFAELSWRRSGKLIGSFREIMNQLEKFIAGLGKE